MPPINKHELYGELISNHRRGFLQRKGRISRDERIRRVEEFHENLRAKTKENELPQNQKNLDKAYADLLFLRKMLVPVAKPSPDAIVFRFEQVATTKTIEEIGTNNITARKNAVRAKYSGSQAKNKLGALEAELARWSELFTPRQGKPSKVVFTTREMGQLFNQVFEQRISPLLPKDASAAVGHAIELFRQEEPKIHEEMRKMREEGAN